ncbi:hypothetical protein AK88_02663 [Plasmodium fragile]|uniref:HECT-type E3 ubiquitin transferase n=1 Tax=Plasmodium fragile TaxID=5857 RepID=A0A0D9QKR7_PLAFR|nr:uncharacterized protein AK88_02663 [Plasmodium fragile]KJP87635.1 hypothetical protein AK88_02663 [Plasmodium fragile]
MFNGESKNSRKINLSGKKHVILNKDSFIERAKKEKEIHLNLTRRKNAFKIIGTYVSFKKCLEKRRNEIQILIGKRISDVMLLQNLVAPDVYERALRICLHEFSLSSTFLYSSRSCYYYYKGMNFESLYPPVKHLLDVVKLYGKVGQLDEPHSVGEGKSEQDGRGSAQMGGSEPAKDTNRKEAIHVSNKFLYRHKKEIQILLNHLDVLLGEYHLYGENIYGEYHSGMRNVRRCRGHLLSGSQGGVSSSVNDDQHKRYDNGQVLYMYHMYNFILNKSFCAHMEKEMNSLKEKKMESKQHPCNDNNVLQSLHKISDYIILTMDGIIHILKKLLLCYTPKQISKCSSTKLLIYLCDLIYIFLLSLKMKGHEIKHENVEEVKGKVNVLLQFVCISVDHHLKDCHSLYIAFFKYSIYEIFSTPIDVKKELGMMKLLLLKIVNKTYERHDMNIMQELVYSDENLLLHLNKYHLFNHISFDQKNISGVNLFKNMLLFVHTNEALVQDNVLNILLEAYLFLSLKYHPYVYKVGGGGTRDRIDNSVEGDEGVGGGTHCGGGKDDDDAHTDEQGDLSSSSPRTGLFCSNSNSNSNSNTEHIQTEDVVGKKRSTSIGGASWEQSTPNKKKEVHADLWKSYKGLSHMGFYYSKGVVDSLIQICKKGGFRRLDALLFFLLPFRTIHRSIFRRYRNYYEFVKNVSNQECVIAGRRSELINWRRATAHGGNRIGGNGLGDNRGEEVVAGSGSLTRGAAAGSLFGEGASASWNGPTYGLLPQTRPLSRDQPIQKTAWRTHRHRPLFSLKNLMRAKGKRGKRSCDGDLLSNDIILKVKKILIEHDMHIYLVREVYLLWFTNCKANDTMFFKYLSAFPYFDHTIVSIYISSLCFLLHYYIVANMFVNLINIQSFKVCKNFMTTVAFKKVCKLLLMSLWVMLKKSMYSINCEVVNRLACEEKGVVGRDGGEAGGEDTELEDFTEAITEEDTYNDEDEQYEREMNRREERAIEEIEGGAAHQAGRHVSDGHVSGGEDLCEPLRCFEQIPISVYAKDEPFLRSNGEGLADCKAEDLLEALDCLSTGGPSSVERIYPSSSHHLMSQGMHFSTCDTYDGIGIANTNRLSSSFKSSMHSSRGGEDASAIISALISYMLYNRDRRGLNYILPLLLKKLYKVNGYVHLFEEDFFVIKETSSLLKNRFNIIGDQNNSGSGSNQMSSSNTGSGNYDTESHLFIDKNDAYLNYNVKHVNELANYLLRFTPFTLPFDDRILIFYNNRNKSKESIRDDSRFSLVDVKHHLIRRTHIVEDAFILLHMLDATQVKQNIRVAFIDHNGNEETGIDGGGLFKEFMILLCREIFHSKFFLFDSVHNDTLYPKRFHSNDNLNLYTFAGKVIGKAIYERILIESVFNDVFLSFLLCDDIDLDVDIDINDLYFIDQHVFKSLLFIQNTPHVENLSLTFCIYEGKKPDVGDVQRYEDIISYFQALGKQLSAGAAAATTGGATTGGRFVGGGSGLGNGSRGNVVRRFFSHTGVSPDHDNINSFFNIIDNLDALIHTLDRNLSSLSPVPLEDHVPEVNTTERYHGGANYDAGSPTVQTLLRRNELNLSPTSNGVLLGSHGQVLPYPLRSANDLDSDDAVNVRTDDAAGVSIDDAAGARVDAAGVRTDDLVCIDLIENGRNIPVDDKNKKQYIKLYINYKFKKMVRKKTQAFLKGLSELIPTKWLKLFNAHELKTLISGNDKCFDVDDLRRNVVYGGGYNANSETVVNLYHILKTFSPKEKSLFLMFVTSCSRSPLLGFQELYPKFCIFRVVDHTRLPTASTCVNLLKLPDYASREILRKNLLTAISGTQGFDLS